MNRQIIPLVALVVLAVAGDVSAADTVEIRGTMQELSVPVTFAGYTWDAQSFAGFWYDLEKDVSSETLAMQALGAYVNTIPSYGLTYTATMRDAEYKNPSLDIAGNDYWAMGWFAGKYMAVNAKPDVLSEIILEMGSTDKKTLATGESWDIGNSYTLIAKQIDLDGDKVWLALEKTGVEVESSIIDIGQNPCGDTFVNLHEYSMATTDTFVYQPDIGSESDVPIFTVAVTAIFRGTDVNLVQLKYAMLIDSELLTIGSDYESHEMMVTSITATSVTLQNGHSMTLTQDSDIDIMGDIIFRVADDCDGDATTEYRFYPMVERTICGVDPTPDPMPTVTATAEPISISTVTIADVTMQLGATTDVPIRLLNSTGVGGVTATLTFDPSIVDVTSVVAGDFDSVFSPDYSGVSSGILRITCTKIGTDLTGDLTIATVTLAAVATSGSCELGLSAELSTASGVAVPSSTDNGTLTISGRTPGDVTGDGVVNIGDAVLLFNWVSFPNERGTTYVLQ